MAANIKALNEQPQEFTDRLLSEFNISEDDFSVRVASSVDKLFWIRVERDQGSVATITDFKRASLSDHQVADALGLALQGAAKNIDANKLVFQNIIPSTTSSSESLELAKKEAAFITRIVILYADGQRQRITEIETLEQAGKHDLHIALETVEK